MAPTLPKPDVRIVRGGAAPAVPRLRVARGVGRWLSRGLLGGLLLVASVASGACARRDPPPVAPAPPLPADPDVALGPMEEECDAMLAALGVYKACPHLEARDRGNLDAWIERANRDFASSRKADPEPNARHAIAAACRKATDSVRAATERCLAGPPPKGDLDE